MIDRYQPIIDSEITALPRDEFEAQLTEAYRVGARRRFILLGQRLVWDVVRRTMCGPRRRPHHSDLYSAGVLVFIELFDRGPNLRLEQVPEHFRKAVYWRLRKWLHEQGVSVRGSGGTGCTLLGSEISSVDDWDFMESVDQAAKSRLLELREQADPRNRIAYAFRAQLAERCEWEREKELRKRALRSRIQAVAAKEPAYQPPKPRENPAAFDPATTATPRELREQGLTWREIGERLGISTATAYRAAHSRTQRSPQELRESSLLSQAWRRARREQMTERAS